MDSRCTTDYRKHVVRLEIVRKGGGWPVCSRRSGNGTGFGAIKSVCGASLANLTCHIYCWRVALLATKTEVNGFRHILLAVSEEVRMLDRNEPINSGHAFFLLHLCESGSCGPCTKNMKVQWGLIVGDNDR